MTAQHRYLASAAMVAAMLSGSAALAQAVADAPQDAQASAAASGDIIVTAQRRSERARDVPISLTALTGDQLVAAGVTDTSSLTNVTPGLKMDRVGNFTLPAIRGITTTVTGPGADANVAIYLDGIYQPSTTSNTFDLPDVERVEVLKGPQGTLFGRNATGGAIQVFTRDPSYTPNGSVTVSYGSFNTLTVKGFVSAPLVTDKVALSVAGFYESSDTYYRNLRPSGPGLEGAETKLVRAKLRLDPTDNLKIVLTGRYSDRRESVAIYGSPLNGNTVGRLLAPDAIIPVRPYDVALNDESRPQRVRAWDMSGRIEYELGSGTFTSLTGYTHSKLSNVLDADYSYAPNGLGVNYHVSTYDKYFSQELSYASAMDGPFNFVVGAFYTKGEGAWHPLSVQTPTFAVSIYGIQKVESVAGFGEVYFDVTDRFSIIAGLRYSWEQRSLDSATVFGLNAPRPAALNRRGQQSWDSATPRLSLRYKLTPDSNVYFTYSQGFKSGVYNTSASTNDLANPEKIRAYEIGYKGRIADAVSLNAAAFYYDYKDLQANVLTNVGGVPLSFLRNAARARIFGFEADASVQFSSAFDIRAAVSVLDGKYKDFTSASVNVPCTNIPAAGVPCSTVGTPTNTGNRSVPYDASGMRMIRAPEFTASITGNAHFDMAGGQLDLTGTMYYSSRLFFTFDQRIQQPGYVSLDARASWSPANSGLTLAVYGKNLTDNAVIGGTFITEVADGVSYMPPRSYGMSASYKF